MEELNGTDYLTIRYWPLEVPDDIYVMGLTKQHLLTKDELDRAREAFEDFKAKYWADDADYSYREMKAADPEFSAMCGHSWDCRNNLGKPRSLAVHIDKWIEGRVKANKWQPTKDSPLYARGGMRWCLDGGIKGVNRVLPDACGNCIRSFKAEYGEDAMEFTSDPYHPAEVTMDL